MHPLFKKHTGATVSDKNDRIHHCIEIEWHIQRKSNSGIFGWSSADENNVLSSSAGEDDDNDDDKMMMMRLLTMDMERMCVCLTQGHLSSMCHCLHSPQQPTRVLLMIPIPKFPTWKLPTLMLMSLKPKKPTKNPSPKKPPSPNMESFWWTTWPQPRLH